MDKLPTKGKQASFFVVENDQEGETKVSKDQKDFIYLHYVLYADPEDMVMILDWLHNYAQELEEYKKQESIYNKKPSSKIAKKKTNAFEKVQEKEKTK